LIIGIGLEVRPKIRLFRKPTLSKLGLIVDFLGELREVKKGLNYSPFHWEGPKKVWGIFWLKGGSLDLRVRIWEGRVSWANLGLELLGGVYLPFGRGSFGNCWVVPFSLKKGFFRDF